MEPKKPYSEEATRRLRQAMDSLREKALGARSTELWREIAAALQQGADPHLPEQPVCDGKYPSDLVMLAAHCSDAMQGSDIFNACERALERGADVHVNNDSPLLIASMVGHPDMVRMLIRHGADKTARDPATHATFLHGWARRALDTSAQEVREWCRGVKLSGEGAAHSLFEARTISGETPLHCCQSANAAIALIGAGADLTAQTPKHYMPAHSWNLQMHKDLLSPQMQGHHPMELLKIHTLHFSGNFQHRMDFVFDSHYWDGPRNDASIRKVWDECFDAARVRRNLSLARADDHVMVQYIQGMQANRVKPSSL